MNLRKESKIVAVAVAVAVFAPAAAVADTHTVAAGATETLSGITETTRTVKDGGGTLVLSGKNSLASVQIDAGTLKFSGGATTISSSATGASATAALFGQAAGETIVTDGATVTMKTGNYATLVNGTLTIADGTFDASDIAEVLNGSGSTSGSRIVIGDGGILKAKILRPTFKTDSAMKDSISVDLEEGGALYVRQFRADASAKWYGRINFNGGVLYPTVAGTSGNDTTYLFLGDTSRPGWTEDTITPTVLEGGARIHADFNNWVNKSFASGAASDGGLHVSGKAVLHWLAEGSSYNGGTWLESDTGGTFAVNGNKAETSLGAVPATPSANIWVTGSNHTLFSESSAKFATHPNRTVFVKDGCRFYVGAQGPFVIGGEIRGEIAEGKVDPTGTALHVKNNWPGSVVLDPGPTRTNDIGRLIDYGRLEITSGVTRVTAASGGGVREDNALGFVCGNGAYAANKGSLAVNGGTLLAPPQASGSRYFILTNNAQVVVSNGGAIDMPAATFANGYKSTATTTIGGDGPGYVCVTNFQVSFGGSASILNLGEGGILETSQFGIQANSSATVNFDGGTIRTRGSAIGLGANDATASRWNDVSLYARDGGAVFDAAAGDIYLRIPLLSGAAADGGLRKTGPATLFITTNCTYNGATRIEQGTVRLTSARALSGDLEIIGDASGCGCLRVAAGQDISGLTLALPSASALDADAPRGRYKIIDAPDGAFTGELSLSADFPADKWQVRYASDRKAAYLEPVKAFIMIFR